MFRKGLRFHDSIDTSCVIRYNTTESLVIWDEQRTWRGRVGDTMMREELIELLRDGLSHLYDADRLRKSPLAALFGVANQPDAASILRSMLTEAVESLKPGEGTPSQSRDWRLYDALFYAYVQQLEQRIVADQLGLSVRHLRREQRAALEVLADTLWEQIDPAKLHGDAGASVFSNQSGAIGPTLNQELSWLKDLPTEKPTDLREVLFEALNLARSLATGHRAHIQVMVGDGLPHLAVHPVALNQILLNLLSVAIPQAADGKVHVSARPLRWEVEIQIQVGRPLSGSWPVSDDDTASLEMASQLTHLCGGKLALPGEKGEALSATVILPALNQLVVLAVDDNADTLQLLERYTAGTRYHLVGTRDPGQVLNLAQKLSPQIIVLDVMMPQVDGWKVIGMLRQHPLTSHIPIIVCTILAQEKLALSLGASGFIRKPVTRQALLDALNHRVERMEPVPEPRSERGSR
jgi:CheY-like chemotaxis protein